ncbi:MAG: DUF1415 domain-containing protein [Saprospiraceae bacterium]
MDFIKVTKSWIQSFVIGLNICPFASLPFREDKIRYRLEESVSTEKLVETLMEELNILQHNKNTEIETSILIHPNVLLDFLDYNDFLSIAEAVLEEMDLEGEIQIASFHPDYQFAGEAKNAPSNYVTRSPFPMLHLLRECSVTKAIEIHPNTKQIPFDNIQKLNELGLEEIKKLNKT